MFSVLDWPYKIQFKVYENKYLKCTYEETSFHVGQGYDKNVYLPQKNDI